MLYILNNDFFNSFTGAYRPYIKLTQPILDKHYIHTRQWLILRDIANFQPTTLVKISHRHSIEKTTARKIIKILLDNKWIIAEPGADKREKLLSLTHSGKTLFEIINQEITIVQQENIKKVGLTDIQLSETIDIMSQIHETLNREETE
ncbi:MarR family transcriptional regulator [Staphylococcus saccharolyticus]|uniref:MarR family winged helix-turn-helix transcriptional regulator n=1 Tax=Staphylococcus saccharolyticus TaxID=33028 RepID=UPI00102DAD28|nr:winged helix DNA-binding protein [Staphylococcus saccharolyticus]MBL7573572.1 MarR family transcriptional regulator [Staphylococcus saccharolyticus]MBL7584637.1 MarR family transcriptional regulator [Staphylococcus saccharolyticus]MBL7639498.1 MarR family transcriptional regulator [Staphylococcus saccharolyticus]QRJ68811.1 MarR family transcriptional regulator [Staphylococcus saccharolyticus]TAA92134.1 MarR family transcriptional regulator [Staphylococcus saccharolyticus]